MDLIMKKTSWTLIGVVSALTGSVILSVLISVAFSMRSESVFLASLQDVKTVTSTPAVPTKSVFREELPAVLARRASPVLSLYRKGKDDRILLADHRIGTATALTSDGWLITSASVIENVRPADVLVWNGLVSQAPTRMVIDRINRTVYLKIAGDQYPSVAFSRAWDATPGSLAWIEPTESAFLPASLVSIRRRSSGDQKIVEEAMRQFEFAVQMNPEERGAPIWDTSGALVGIVETSGARPLAILSTSISTSFASLLDTGSIHHATMSATVSDMDALLRDRKKLKLPDHGAIVEKVAGTSPLKVNDVIVRVDRDILEGTADLGELLSEYRPGTNVTLSVWRNGTQMDVPMTLGNVTTSEMLLSL